MIVILLLLLSVSALWYVLWKRLCCNEMLLREFFLSRCQPIFPPEGLRRWNAMIEKLGAVFNSCLNLRLLTAKRRCCQKVSRAIQVTREPKFRLLIFALVY